MSETETMQKLHQLSITGKVLSAEEQAALQNWYETLDSEEDKLKPENSQTLQNYLENTSKQVAQISHEIESLVFHNANLRSENQALRKTFRIIKV
jgi:hypothetical protein